MSTRKRIIFFGFFLFFSIFFILSVWEVFKVCEATDVSSSEWSRQREGKVSMCRMQSYVKLRNYGSQLGDNEWHNRRRPDLPSTLPTNPWWSTYVTSLISQHFRTGRISFSIRFHMRPPSNSKCCSTKRGKKCENLPF